MLTEPAFYATAIPAVILLGLSKGGFAGLGVLGMPLMALTIPPVQAAAVTLRGRPRLPAGGRPGVARHLLMRTQGGTSGTPAVLDRTGAT